MFDYFENLKKCPVCNSDIKVHFSFVTKVERYKCSSNTNHYTFIPNKIWIMPDKSILIEMFPTYYTISIFNAPSPLDICPEFKFDYDLSIIPEDFIKFCIKVKENIEFC